MFFVGLHQPSDAKHFQRACVSINRLRKRMAPLNCPNVLLDCGAFTELAQYGKYRETPLDYARQIKRLFAHHVAKVSIAVAQDYMCEPFMLAKTGLTIDDHQRLTIERYDALINEWLPCPIMPVLQGYEPQSYVQHINQYGWRIRPGMHVGVGSVCKRNTSPKSIIEVLGAIKNARPDIRLHGFGVKSTSLRNADVRRLLYSADSMAWSYAARIEGRNQNDWQEAHNFMCKIEGYTQ